MIKVYCDKCGAEITNDPFSIVAHTESECSDEEYVFELCGKCGREVIKTIDDTIWE